MQLKKTLGKAEKGSNRMGTSSDGTPKFEVIYIEDVDQLESLLNERQTLPQKFRGWLESHEFEIRDSLAAIDIPYKIIRSSWDPS
jgi:hypothetical protein